MCGCVWVCVCVWSMSTIAARRGCSACSGSAGPGWLQGACNQQRVAEYVRVCVCVCVFEGPIAIGPHPRQVADGEVVYASALRSTGCERCAREAFARAGRVCMGVDVGMVGMGKWVCGWV